MSDTAVPEQGAENGRFGESLQEMERLYITLAARSFGTGHSANATLAGWSASLGISKSKKDFIGQWRPEDSDRYVRTAMDILKGLHEEGVTKCCSGFDEDVCPEQGLFKGLVHWGIKSIGPNKIYESGSGAGLAGNASNGLDGEFKARTVQVAWDRASMRRWAEWASDFV